MVRAQFLLAGPVQSENVVPSFPDIIWHSEATPHVINTMWKHYVCFGFFGGNLLRLAKRDPRLAARGSGSQARKIVSPTQTAEALELQQTL